MTHKITDCETCVVVGCKTPATKLWEPLMNLHGTKVPVCARHYGSRLWWYRGTIYCKDEEPQ